MVTVSQKPELKRIQGEIARGVGLTLEGDDMLSRSIVPFQGKAGDSVDVLSIHDTAKEVAKECKGLPLAIITVAGALKRKTKPSWEDALIQLRDAEPKKIPGVHTKVYKFLRLSYDHLGENEAKYLFLFCSLFEEDRDIWSEDLVSCPNLEDISIWGPTNISALCSHQLPTTYFSKLHILVVSDCGKLRNLISLSVARGLLNIGLLAISNCQSMEEVIIKEEQQGEGIMTKAEPLQSS
ncbi:hypothetical protein RDI58_000860 [Solanum bulbocastanum]|uniref:Disease resistance protein At4g27190-like leucine-rich repeats domain-containing protein n=1 Tax=Solanum bulbocastanum TaxID=147425 RepID=A0AAN8UD58_SOLBU